MKLKKIILISLCLHFSYLVDATSFFDKDHVSKALTAFSFDSLFPQSSFSRAHQLSKQVWMDVLLYKKYQKMCDEEKKCDGQKERLDKLVDQVLKFHHAVGLIKGSSHLVLDDVEYVHYIVDQIRTNFNNTKEPSSLPKFFCVKVVLDKIENTLDKIIQE